jgi:microsomal epoxide hydrolase
MARLGYDCYAAQGGDWGYAVSSALGQLYPERVVGIHLNLIWVLAPAEVEDPSEGIPPEEWKRHRDRVQWWEREKAYGDLHGTKPQTLSYGLNDSPVGLAAWIVEKWRTWSQCNGDVESRFSKDQILTNIMIYWWTQTMGSSARLYYETFLMPPTEWQVEVPTAVAVFPGELAFTPRKWVERCFHLTRWTEMPRGGHFAAMEEPELLVQDIREHFRDLRQGLR